MTAPPVNMTTGTLVFSTDGWDQPQRDADGYGRNDPCQSPKTLKAARDLIAQRREQRRDRVRPWIAPEHDRFARYLRRDRHSELVIPEFTALRMQREADWRKREAAALSE